jgi:dihydrofolate reductase
MEIIVAIENDWGIGYNGNLLCSIREDMEHFVEKTTGKTVIMGRNTYEKLRKKPLPNRTNIVLTSRPIETFDNLLAYKNIKEVIEYIKELDLNMVAVIGGEQIYKLLYEYCSIAYVTKMHKDMTHDKTFPNLDLLSNWRIIEKSDIYHNESNDIDYQFFTYQNNQPKILKKQVKN